ncbi:hypothetical protein F5X99DRAFT_367871 [Biscogniauxia marginata]|nr:hypothetical protein F5X99DRAFT_367871 [Biscogniauxia marginata]
MAPVTIERSGSRKNTTEKGKGASPAKKRIETSEISIELPIKRRGKRKSTRDGEEEKDVQDAAQSTELETPKRQKMAVRTREEKTASGGRKKQIEVQIPSSSTKRVRSSPVPDSEDEEEESEDEIEIEPISASKQLEEEAGQQLASQAHDPDPTAQPKPKSKHVVFGDDDDVEKFVVAGAETDKEIKETHDEADSDDDDDEAPEAVSTQAAAKDRIKSAQAATEAAAKHAASLKRKRQERDNLFKQQAEKRKRTRIEERVRSKVPKADSGHHEGAAETEKATTGRRRAEKHKLPDALPAEFLADSSSESENETALKKAAKKPKKIDFDTAVGTPGNEGKRPRDKIVGTTRYRVLAEQGDKNLPPKMNKNSLIMRENMLRRKRKAVTLNKTNGFFVRK